MRRAARLLKHARSAAGRGVDYKLSLHCNISSAALIGLSCIARAVKNALPLAASLGRSAGIHPFESYISLALYASVGYLGDHIPVRWVFAILAAIILSGFVIRVSAGQPATYRPAISPDPMRAAHSPTRSGNTPVVSSGLGRAHAAASRGDDEHA
jgi:hypothetical protein